jgi:radical SAM superfamily enzyme YgiQ (UPF0313 family)
MGCSIKPPCDFCASPIMCSKVLSKPLKYVEREVLYLANKYPNFCFIRDENFFMQKDWDDRLKILKKIGSYVHYPTTKLYLFASANTLTLKKVQAMKDANVYMVCLGLEDPTKEYNKNKKLDLACAMLKEAGIYVYLSFIVNPLEVIGTKQSKFFYNCLNSRLKELKPEMICGNFLMPFPGTALWDKYYAYIDREDYKYYDSKTPFLVRNKILQEKLKFFLFWYQYQYYTSEFYNTEIRDFYCNDTLHMRFKELKKHFFEEYEILWNKRA